jgi:hypothetical protein
MPSQIGNIGNTVDVAANYLRTKPSTRFATRQLAFMRIDCTGIENDAEDSNSLFTRVVRGVQLVAEVYAVGTPDSGSVIVVVGADTNAAEAELNSMAVNLTTQFSNQGITATVVNVGLYGSGFLGLGTNNFSEQGVNNANRSGLRPPYENESVAQYD